MRPGAVLSPLPENKKKRSKRSRTSDKSKAGATGNTAHPTGMGGGSDGDGRLCKLEGEGIRQDGRDAMSKNCSTTKFE